MVIFFKSLLVRFYRYTRKYIVPYFFSYIFYLFYGLYIKTIRFKFNNLDSFYELITKQPCIIVFWHRHLFLLPGSFKKIDRKYRYAAVISKSRDGALLEAIIHLYHAKVRIVGIEAKKRHLSLLASQKALEAGESLLITPDGPRGPCQKMKAGAIDLAIRCNVPLLLFSWKSNHFWQLKSWDRFLIPKPFSKVICSFHAPIQPIGTREILLQHVEKTLNAMDSE